MVCERVRRVHWRLSSVLTVSMPGAGLAPAMRALHARVWKNVTGVPLSILGLCGVSVGFVYVRVKLNWIETILFESLRIGKLFRGSEPGGGVRTSSRMRRVT